MGKSRVDELRRRFDRLVGANRAQEEEKDNRGQDRDQQGADEQGQKNPVLPLTVSTGLITRDTPFREIGPISLETFRAILHGAGSPVGPVEEVHRIAGSDSALLVSIMRRESSLGKSDLAGRTRNPLGLKLPDNSGFCTYGCWATAIAEWRLRLRDPQYKGGVYYPASHGGVALSLADFLTIYVGGPGCLSSGMQTCANGENRESINRYIDAVVVDLNADLGTVVKPNPDQGGLVFGRVPNPNIVNRIIPGDVGGGAWVPVGRNSAFDHLGTRSFRGICLHIMEGTLDGTDAYFRNDARMRALTDFGIGWSVSRNAYQIYQWNSMASNRAPWASGPATDPEGDGPAFLAKYGVNAVNRDLRSIELAGRAGQVLPAESITLAVNLMAYLADQAKVPWHEWPYRNGLPLIYGHWEFSPKVCPGSWVIAQIPSMSDRVGQVLKRYQTGG